MTKVLLILPYFGAFNNYFQLFLESCRYNSSVDFLIITDNREKISYPQNIRVIYSTFDELRKKIQKLYPFEIKLNKPYKLCDFRPAYGEIFSEYLQSYDFWGHCDCDLIFGDIRYFITDDILENYDKILTRGHLSLYRNNSKVNSMYRRNVEGTLDYRNVFASSKAFTFDEWGGISKKWKYLFPDKMYDEIIFDDVHCLKSNFVSYQKMDDQLEQKRKYSIFQYDEGKLFRFYINMETKVVENDLSCYAHFQKRDMTVEQGVDFSKYLIIPNKFIPLQKIDVNFLKKYAAPKLFYKKYYQITSVRRKILRQCFNY